MRRLNKKDAASIFKAYKKELAERTTRLNVALKGVGREGPGEGLFDIIHQEFDSLSGASRAANLTRLEEVSRQAASFARLLRNKVKEGVEVEKEFAVLRLLCVELGALSLAMDHDAAPDWPAEPGEKLGSALVEIDQYLRVRDRE